MEIYEEGSRTMDNDVLWSFFQRNSYLFRFLAIIYCLMSYCVANSALVISEVLTDEFKTVYYIELENVSNKNTTLKSLVINNGYDKCEINDSISFCPNEVKMIIFPDFVFSDSTMLDSSRLIGAKKNLQLTESLTLHIDDSDIADTFVCGKIFALCIARSSMLVDTEFNHIASEFTASSPSPLKKNTIVKMKRVVCYAYDKSGNRKQSQGRQIVYDEKAKKEDGDFDVERFNMYDFEVTVYPNPTEGNVIVEFSETGNYTLQLLSLNSSVISNTALNNNSKAEIKMSHLNANVYILSVYKDGEFKTSMKIIKK